MLPVCLNKLGSWGLFWLSFLSFQNLLNLLKVLMSPLCLPAQFKIGLSAKELLEFFKKLVLIKT